MDDDGVDEALAPDDDGVPDHESVPRTRKRGQSLGQSIGGVLFGFEQQVWRNIPPPHELVHHARPDDPVPAGDGGFMTLEMPEPLGPPPAPGAPPGPAPEPEPAPGPTSDPASQPGPAPDAGDAPGPRASLG
jgi:hypothetical protein